MKNDTIKLEHNLIENWIEKNSSVLDLGCGDGDLLSVLIEQKNVKAQGIELDEQAIYKCVARGISVFHEDIDNCLKGYADKSFDYVILYQSLQEVKKLSVVLSEALRVGKKVIVGFPNFVYYKARLQIFLNGKVPVTPSLPFHWYDTPNLHFLSISDFVEYCRKGDVKIEDSVFIGKSKVVKILPNLFALNGIFLISK
ncbi:MAG: methionine biosynthesis protein MetW [Elusimicrobia bacterium]|nr:methionine biosynthesis protein MetW [Elusimicrobiota bacterium]